MPICAAHKTAYTCLGRDHRPQSSAQPQSCGRSRESAWNHQPLTQLLRRPVRPHRHVRRRSLPPASRQTAATTLGQRRRPAHRQLADRLGMPHRRCPVSLRGSRSKADDGAGRYSHPHPLRRKKGGQRSPGEPLPPLPRAAE